MDILYILFSPAFSVIRAIIVNRIQHLSSEAALSDLVYYFHPKSFLQPVKNDVNSQKAFNRYPRVHLPSADIRCILIQVHHAQDRLQ
jgi:hypothetical protein